jgi:hypothetical protein
MTAHDLEKLRSQFHRAIGSYSARISSDRQLAQATDKLLCCIDDVSHFRLRTPQLVDTRAYKGNESEDYPGTLPEFVGRRRLELEPLAASYNCTIAAHPVLKDRFVVRWLHEWESDAQATAAGENSL